MFVRNTIHSIKSYSVVRSISSLNMHKCRSGTSIGRAELSYVDVVRIDLQYGIHRRAHLDVLTQLLLQKSSTRSSGRPGEP